VRRSARRSTGASPAPRRRTPTAVQSTGREVRVVSACLSQSPDMFSRLQARCSAAHRPSISSSRRVPTRPSTTCGRALPTAPPGASTRCCPTTVRRSVGLLPDPTARRKFRPGPPPRTARLARFAPRLLPTWRPRSAASSRRSGHAASPSRLTCTLAPTRVSITPRRRSTRRRTRAPTRWLTASRRRFFLRRTPR